MNNGLLYPLDVLYARAGIAPPIVKRISRDRVPAPYDRLLVHEDDMTQTLERHCGARIAVRVLHATLKGRSYFRRVLLVEEPSARPLAMAAVRIRLDAIGAANRAKILRQREPIGRILRDGGIDFLSRPTAFFEAKPNAEMMALFWMAEPRTLYGRRTHVTLGGARIGDIVEILPLV
jgi:chorismate-pyruvate lyase